MSSGSGGSSFVLKSDGVAISSQTVDLHVNALNVDGEIRATSVDFDTANISGTLSASYIDVDSITVKNANIESLYASKIIGGSLGGYIASGAISDAGNPLSELNVRDFTANSIGCGTTVRIGSAGSNVTIGGAKVTLVSGGTTKEKLWSDILSGSGGAVFG